MSPSLIFIGYIKEVHLYNQEPRLLKHTILNRVLQFQVRYTFLAPSPKNISGENGFLALTLGLRCCRAMLFS